MTFQPVIPATGNLGWSFLTRTREAQKEAFDTSSVINRQVEYFRDNIGDIKTADDLVSDRRLLSVALGAFGLGDDINNRFFIKKVLEEGTADEKSFANRLADKRYFAMAETFGFDRKPPNTALASFPGDLVARFQDSEFEIAVGRQDENLRLALSLERDLAELADRDLSEDATWFTIMGTPPLRKVFETALGLPSALGSIDVDKQLEIFRDKSVAVFGSGDPTAFTNSDLREDLIRKFLFRTELQTAASATVKGSVALSLLSVQSGSAAAI